MDEVKCIIINDDVCFYNTDKPPLEKKRLGLFQRVALEGGTRIVYHELCEVKYPHPQAPEFASISVLRFEEVEPDPGTKALFSRVVDEGFALQKISKLKHEVK